MEYWPVSAMTIVGIGLFLCGVEVENDVSAYVEYENGATGVFIPSTHEAHGSIIGLSYWWLSNCLKKASGAH